jgi:hypothetical protein
MKKVILAVLVLVLIAAGVVLAVNYQRKPAPLSPKQTPNEQEQIVYVKGVFEVQGKRIMEVIKLNYFQGQAALDEAVKQGFCAPEAKLYDCLPLGYLLAPQTPQQSYFDNFEFSAQGRIKLLRQDELGAYKLAEDQRYEKFKEMISNPQLSWKGIPFTAKVEKGMIVELSEMQLPAGKPAKK